MNDYADIIAEAYQLARPIMPSEQCSAGSVGSLIVSRSGNKYTGICLDFSCSLGFCAEHAAIAEMLKAHESEISTPRAAASPARSRSHENRCPTPRLPPAFGADGSCCSASRS